MEPETEWTPCFVWLRRKLITGEYARGYLMRRKIDGTWQYRRETGQETAQNAIERYTI